MGSSLSELSITAEVAGRSAPSAGLMAQQQRGTCAPDLRSGHVTVLFCRQQSAHQASHAQPNQVTDAYYQHTTTTQTQGLVAAVGLHGSRHDQDGL
jgi:hypothetical protein